MDPYRGLVAVAHSHFRAQVREIPCVLCKIFENHSFVYKFHALRSILYPILDGVVSFKSLIELEK